MGPLWASTKYIGIDVHAESASIAVRNTGGKVVMECVLEAKAHTILQFLAGLSRDSRLTFSLFKLDASLIWRDHSLLVLHGHKSKL